MNNNNLEQSNGNISIHAPESLVQFDSPLFVGADGIKGGGYVKPPLTENSSKLDDMVNSMLPPR
jgi:hypothetical protein